MDTLKEIDRVRKRWLAARKKGDTIMEKLWLRVGLRLKNEIKEKFGDNFEKAKEIFK